MVKAGKKPQVTDIEANALMTDCDLETSVPDWIIEHPETLAVFQELGIDRSESSGMTT